MIEVKICVGSSCHLKGSAKVIEAFQNYIAQEGLEDDVELKASFCMGECIHSVCVEVDGEKIRDVSPDNVSDLIKEKILERLK